MIQSEFQKLVERQNVIQQWILEREQEEERKISLRLRIAYHRGRISELQPRTRILGLVMSCPEKTQVVLVQKLPKPRPAMEVSKILLQRRKILELPLELSVHGCGLIHIAPPVVVRTHEWPQQHHSERQ